MTPADIAIITNVIGPVMREYTAKALAEALAPVMARNAVLEQRILELETRPDPLPGPVGPMGEKGAPGIGVASLIVNADGRLLAHYTDGRSQDAGPVPRGLDGVKGDTGDRGERGEKGLDGSPGGRGDPGAVGERGPQGEKGLDGLHGRDGRDGSPGLPGMPGEKGLDGRHGVDGINGKDGKDGMDGLGFDDFDLTLDEARGWVFRLAQGERVKEWVLGIPFDAKVWSAGTVYPKGAGTTWDGHYWIAQQQTSDQPGEGTPAWRLAVRRGKQGREGKQGKDGSAGRDLTQIDPGTGRKW